MTNEKTRQRRRDIAAYIREGHEDFEACAKFNVSMGTIYLILREYGIRNPSRLKGCKTLRPRTYQILRDLFNGVKPAEVSRRHNLSITIVCRIRDDAAANGWPEVKAEK